jgi:hypothetical protein
VSNRRDRDLWGQDAEAVRAAVDALFGHHPERGGPEREQAAFAVVKAVRPIIEAQVRSELFGEGVAR